MMVVDPTIDFAIALCLSALFASGAIHKAQAPRVFLLSVRGYGAVPDSLAPAFAAVVMISEAAVAAMLLAPAARPLGAFGAAALLLIYAAAMGFNIARGRREIACGCTFGGDAATISVYAVARNILLALGALVLFAPTGGRAMTGFDFVSAALFAASASALFLTSEQMRSVVQRLEQGSVR